MTDTGGKQAIATDGAPGAVGPYSQALRIGDQVFCSGQIGLDPATGELVSEEFSDQARQVFANLDAVLSAAGLGFSDVVRVAIYVVDLDDFSELNEIYAEHFTEPFPARATVEVSALPKDALVEIELLAVASARQP